MAAILGAKSCNALGLHSGLPSSSHPAPCSAMARAALERKLWAPGALPGPAWGGRVIRMARAPTIILLPSLET
jgi:hypothetical protein